MKVDAAKQELHTLLAKDQLTGIPVLVLGNKNDLPNKACVSYHNTKNNMKYFKISCWENDNVDVPLLWLLREVFGDYTIEIIEIVSA